MPEEQDKAVEVSESEALKRVQYLNQLLIHALGHVMTTLEIKEVKVTREFIEKKSVGIVFKHDDDGTVTVTVANAANPEELTKIVGEQMETAARETAPSASEETSEEPGSGDGEAAPGADESGRPVGDLEQVPNASEEHAEPVVSAVN